MLVLQGTLFNIPPGASSRVIALPAEYSGVSLEFIPQRLDVVLLHSEASGTFNGLQLWTIAVDSAEAADVTVNFTLVCTTENVTYNSFASFRNFDSGE